MRTQSPTSVRDYAERWIDDNERYLKASTARVYRGTVNRICAAFGSHRLSEVRWPEIKVWVRSLETSQKNTTNILSVFRSLMRDAEDDGLIEENPLDGRRLRIKDRSPEEDRVLPFDSRERALLLAGCTEPQEKNLFEFLIWSGLRISEAIALQWKDIDLQENRIFVRGARTSDSKEIERTKTKASRRDVKLLQGAKDALLDQQQWTLLLQRGVWLNPRTSEPWSGDQPIRRVFKRLCERVSVPYRNPYQLRHTYASMCLSSGENIAWVASQLGHTNPTITGAVYAKWIQEENDNGGKLAEDAFAR